jgi:Ca2+/Na+ antiporter
MLLQTQIVLSMGIILSVFLFMVNPKFIASSLVILVAFLLASYNVNCTVYGKCENWSWILTACYVFYVVSLIYLVYKNKDNDDSDDSNITQKIIYYD